MARSILQAVVGWLGACALLVASLACDQPAERDVRTKSSPDAKSVSNGSRRREVAAPDQSAGGGGGSPWADARRTEETKNPTPESDAQPDPESPRHTTTAPLGAPPPNDDTLRLTGIRQLAGKHLTLYTDHPSRPEVDNLPAVFDQAVPQWCRYFGIPARRVATWHLTGYLIVDTQRFHAAGLLPDDLPNFLYGYQRREELWLYDQPSDYYRRHLLLHEGTHGFSAWFLGAVGPPWYAEGLAERLATHRWVDGKLTLGYFPPNKQEVPHWGRVKLVKDEVAAQRGMTIGQIMHHGIQSHLRNQSYGWCWAVAAFLENHPRYQERFRELTQHVSIPATEFTHRFEQQFRDDRRELDEEWQLFAMNIEYGYDVSRETVQYAPGRPLPPAGARITLAADRGWQSSGLRLLANTTYQITATGRYQVAQEPDVWWCEPGGVTIRYWRGRPLGVLLGQLRPDQPTAGLTPLARPLVFGLGRTLRPEENGTLYLRINDSPAELSDNSGTLAVRVVASANG